MHDRIDTRLDILDEKTDLFIIGGEEMVVDVFLS